MADVTISQLTRGIPSGNSIVPYSSEGSTLGVPVSAILQNAGNIGIGTGIPEYKLHVAGDLYNGTNNKFLSNRQGSVSWDTAGLHLQIDGTTYGKLGVHYQDSTAYLRSDVGLMLNGTVSATQFGEQGLWTPVLHNDAGPIAGVTYAASPANAGGYTKMGKFVYVYGKLTLTSKNNYNSGRVLIGGLPFKNINQQNFSEGSTIGFNWWSNLNTTGTEGTLGIVSGYVQYNNTRITLIHQRPGFNAVALDGSYLTNSTVLFFSGCYVMD